MAEINYNNLYNQMGLLDQKFYDSTFKKTYDPNKSQTVLEGKSGYDQMKAAYEAEQQVPEKSFISSAMSALNPFSELSAAEMPQVPNVSLGTPQINFNTGITGASSAIPNINGVPMINTSAYNQKLQNTDLVSQIIAANQAANTNRFTNTVAPFPGNQFSQVNNQVPSQNFEFLQSAYEDEDAAQVEYLPGQKKKLSDMGRNFGISSLIGMITGNPIIGLLSKGIKGLAGLNNRMQNSDFGRSRTGADFFKARRDREALARDPNVFKDARDITSRIQRDAGRNDRPDRNISSVTRSSAAKSKGVGGGGYTKSDSNRESYRG